MLEALSKIDWSLEPQPSWNREHEVSDALRALALATEDSGEAAYSRLLYAVGNNHAGTYFPLVLAIIPFLGEILRDRTCNSAARTRALDVLIDLVGSFEPEAGFELVATAAGPCPLKELLMDRTLELTKDVEALDESREVELAGELLELLRE
jgi:hypothetical protein